MKQLRILMLPVILSFLTSCGAKEKYRMVEKTDANGYKYETVTNDPMGVRIYTLQNGLKVYLSVNRDEPRIKTFIPVKAGSTYDPAETTGLAHYLEHMMFKGTDEIGTVNWKEEKALLKKISDLYEAHKKTSDPAEKKAIYAQIDKLSGEAGKYAVANEYDKLVATIGARGTNAYTTFERTVYMNDIPSNELEKWLEIEKERFETLVLRIFHTELEAVYEEFNMSQDRDSRKSSYALMAGLFPHHPYGTQTTLGKAEHLKNPSMVNIHNYFDSYYVPNNMAIAMSGDLNFEETIKLVDKTFGKLKTGNVPEFKSPVEEPISAPVVKEVFGPDAESMSLAFRFKGLGSEDEKFVTLIDGLLNNSKAGLIDLNLNQKQKVLRAGCYADFLMHYGMHKFYGKPRQGQKLEEVTKLVLAEIEKIKKGEFEDWLIDAVINDYRLSKIRSQESNWRAHEFAETFANNVNWVNHLKFVDELEKITKEQLVKFAQEHYKDNYVVVYKRKGKDEHVVKVDKPQITPASIDRKSQSEFYKKLTAKETPALKPLWVDFKKEIHTEELTPGVEFDYLKNKSNELFNLVYIFDMGKNNIKQLPIAVDYLPYLGTDKYTAAELQQEMFKYGLSLGVNSSNERCYVYISGLEKSFDKGLELIEHILANAKADAEAYQKYVDGILKKRADRKLNKNQILQGALMNYAKYGKKSAYTDVLSEKELRSIDPNSLTDLIGTLKEYKHRVFYYGVNDQEKVVAHLKAKHQLAAELKDVPAPVVYPELEYNKDKVFFVDYDMVQANLIMLSKDEKLNTKLMPEINLFNEYYGGSMASIVFQEIRESRALAYTAYSYFSTPSQKDRSHYSFSYVATSVDKVEEATKAMLNLLNGMPYEEKQFDEARQNLVKKIESERITKESIYWTYLRNLRKGIDYDYRQDVYEKVKMADLNDVKTFFEKHIANKPHAFLVVASKKDIDMKVLSRLGEVHELSLEEIFNY
ncbi:MAG: M16 family metallopeptidase [Marinifilaceae bacterium]